MGASRLWLTLSRTTICPLLNSPLARRCGSRTGQCHPQRFGLLRIQRLRTTLPIQLSLRTRDAAAQDGPLMAIAALITDTPQSPHQDGYLPQDPAMFRTVERFVVTHSGLRSVYLTMTLSPVLIAVPDVSIMSHFLFLRRWSTLSFTVICDT